MRRKLLTITDILGQDERAALLRETLGRSTELDAILVVIKIGDEIGVGFAGVSGAVEALGFLEMAKMTLLSPEEE